MVSGNDSSKWSPEKVERFRKLVLRHVSNGGTVMDACAQFEYETNGLHTKRQNYIKWVLSIKSTCKEELRRAQEIGVSAKMVRISENMQEVSEEVKSPVSRETPLLHDEIEENALASIRELLDDRKQVLLSLNQVETKLEVAQKNTEDLEEERQLLQLAVEKRETEAAKLQRQLVDKQSQHEQLTEDYRQLRANGVKEQERLTQQAQELQLKYENLNADYSRFRSNSERELHKLESVLREEQVKYTQLLSLYDRAKQENEALVKNINDFARHMTNILPHEPASSSTVTALPIRAVVSNE